jgi:uncharacterized protein
MEKKKIAVIGGGVAGLTAAYYLNKLHDVKLFEKSGKLGGNAYSIETKNGDIADIAVAVFGREGYGHFFALLDELGLETDLCPNTFMSMHNMDTKEGLYLTPSLKGGLTQGLDLIKLDHLKSIYKMYKGLKSANELLDRGALTGKTMGQCIDMVHELTGNPRLVMICVLCLLSSMSVEEVLKTPASFFLGKLKVHNDVISPKVIFSVVACADGTRSYVMGMANTLINPVVLNSSIRCVKRNDKGVILVMEDGSEEEFDEVVFGCNADQALALIEEPTELEKELLGVWKYKDGQIIVHYDHSQFPARELIQAYTYLYTGDKDETFSTSVNGALRFEPQMPDDCDLISTQHPNYEIREDLIEYQTVLRTPMFTFDSIAVIKRLTSLNGKNHSYFCGGHFGYGLHNDAVRSGMVVAEQLGATIPEPKESIFKPSIKGLFKLAKKLRG